MAVYLNYSIEDHEGVKVVNIGGNLSNSTYDELVRVVSGLTQKSNVILNMKDVPVITSSGINSLVQASMDARKKNKRVILLGMKGPLIKMIDTLDLYEFFIFVDSIEEGQMKLEYYL
ncbi:MAG TPA: STAS domain-containing protein [Spirochaetota bacterium]|nr:STAS domain-containing protein [Spirochaetota bacterium]HPQ53278.1 STAS domain-containing protein [Spirochaetota bacterium]